MKRAALKTTALILFLAAASFSGTHEQAAARSSFPAALSHQCPAISVTCPDVNGGADQPVTFTANINSNYPNPHLTFNWTVSAGRIINGQGTNEIKVDATGLDRQSIKATLEVGGLPNSCVRTASCETAIITECTPPIFDEYGDISWQDEQTRLDNFAIQLQSAHTVAGHIIAYAGRRARAGDA